MVVRFFIFEHVFSWLGQWTPSGSLNISTIFGSYPISTFRVGDQINIYYELSIHKIVHYDVTKRICRIGQIEELPHGQPPPLHFPALRPATHDMSFLLGPFRRSHPSTSGSDSSNIQSPKRTKHDQSIEMAETVPKHHSTPAEKSDSSERGTGEEAPPPRVDMLKAVQQRQPKVTDPQPPTQQRPLDSSSQHGDTLGGGGQLC
jgi:hypothetical protein